MSTSVGSICATAALDVEAGVRALHVRERERAQRRLAVDDDHVLEAGQLARASRTWGRNCCSQISTFALRRR